MKSRAFLATIILAVLIAIPTIASAAFIHYFDCDQCHKPNADWSVVGPNGVCVDCHGNGTSTTLNAGAPQGDGAYTGTQGFLPDDASDAFGNNTDAAFQTSHNWGAPDNNPAAGASPASAAMYKTRTNQSAGLVTCTKCHDPHAAYDAAEYVTGNEKMLRTATTYWSAGIGDKTSLNTEQNIDAMCTECHLDWASSIATERGLESHPLDVANYPAFAAANPDRFVAFNPSGSMALMNSGTTMGCSTCHGTHNVGAGNNDGALLKGAGLAVDDKAVCTACHVYQSHPSSAGAPTEIGCLVCHSGHSYNDGTPNYYVLRSEVTIPAGVNLPTAGQTISGLRYLSATTTDAERDANFATYCNGCHGTLADITTSTGGSEDHTSGHDQCSLCHSHYDSAAPDKSFTVGGGGCTSCHGTPPRTNTAGGPDGYAVNGGINYSGDSNFNEANTPHATHALSGSNPVMGVMGCSTCHTSYSANHNEGSFQSVLEVADTKPVLLQTGGLSALYVGAGSGTCTAVYCHSNGNLAAISTTSPTWDNGNGTISVANLNACSACHDDATTTIGVAGKGNTAAHNRHVNTKGYNCNVCHDDTAIDGASVDVAGGKHINGSVELAYDTAYSLGVNDLTGTLASAASCNVYCHSNGDTSGGIVYTDVAWTDTGAAGQCGACHEVAAGDDTTTTITGASLPDAHAKHIAQGIACTTCHTTNGTGGTHLDGEPSLTAGAADRSTCNVCHGSSNGGTGADAEPVWTSAVSVTCATCHTGADISVIGGGTGSGTYMDVDGFYTTGHGDSGLTGAPDCTGCHDAAAVGHFDGDNADRLIGGATANDAYCNTCHVSHNSHFADAQTAGGGSTDGNACAICHNPHGKGMGTNADAMLIVGSGFVDSTDPTDYFNAGNTGVCQVCHVKADGASGINHYNQTDAPDGHNAAQVCTDCHKHTDPVAFEAGAGTNCGDCHAYDATSSYGRINSGAHVLHTTVVDGVIGNEDLTDCAQCHTGADTYTYAAGGNHMDGNVDVAVGYSDAGTVGDLTDDTCATACHTSVVGDGFWTDTALNCDSCHGNAPADGGADGTAHADHIAASVACGTCHTVPGAGNTAHIDDFAGGDSEGVQLVDRGTADADEATVIEASFNDTNNTCDTAACHNPGNDGHIADWTVTTGSTSNCALCHGNAPTSGAHGVHNTVSGNTTAEDRTDCAACHTGADSFTYAHLDGSTTIAVGYSDNATPGDLTDDTCATACHTSVAGDGFWTDTALNCDSCHGNAPTDGGADGTAHADHLAASVACGTCHTVPAAGDTAHIDDFLGGDTEGVQLVDRGTADADEATVIEASFNDTNNTCNTAACHNPSNDGHIADWTVTTGSTSSCTLCHSNTDPGTNSHTQHISLNAKFNTTNGQAACADCHTVPVVMTHLNGTKDINGAKIAGWATPNCTTTCHDDGDDANGVTGVSPGWVLGVGSPDCTICHTVPPATGDHSAHLLAARVTAGMTCNSCHSGTSADSATAAGVKHMDTNSNDVTAGGLYNAVAVSITNYAVAAPSTCDAASCHSSGGQRKWEVPSTCDGCHGNPPATGAHALHTTVTLQTVAEDRTDCAQCHTGADSYINSASGLHQNSSIDVAIGYSNNGTAADPTDDTCATSPCHTSGAGDGFWGDTALNCDACHGNAPADGGGDGTAHADHLAASVTCATCHTVPGAGDTSHITDASGANEGAILLGRATALANEADVIEASFNDTDNTCSTATCHNPSGTGFLADWDTSTSSCALCHVDTTGDPTTGSHTVHRTTPNNYTADIACSECHTVPVAMDHRNATVEVPLDGTIATSGDATAIGTTWNGTTCSTTYCHNGSLIGGALGYSDPGAGVAPTWGDAAYLDGTAANDCNQCHDAPPNPAQGHQNNPSCVTCHDNTNGTNDGFVIAGNHVDGTLDTSGGDNCTDCHNAADIDDGLNGVHSSHTDTGFITGKTVSSGAYGGAGWYTTTYVAGQPVFGCGQCHNGSEGTGHPTSTVLNVDIDPAGETPGAGNVKLLNAAQSTPSYTTLVSVTCASVYCHSDAVGGFKTSPDWYGGTIGTACADCHGNSPATNAHGVHEVGIHYEELYNGTTGLMTATGGLGGEAHGDPAGSSTITCYTCHSGTVTDTANALNVTCNGCHSDTNSIVTGDELARILSGSSTHINGVKDVAFVNMTGFKSKAQLRDNLADADDGSNVLVNIWNRLTGYKAAAADHDEVKVAFATPVFTQGPDTCSTVACHNGNTAIWSDAGVDCMYCHTSLPK